MGNPYPPTAMGMMKDADGRQVNHSVMSGRSIEEMRHMLQESAMRAQDMADREEQASSLAAAGDVAARISLYKESRMKREQREMEQRQTGDKGVLGGPGMESSEDTVSGKAGGDVNGIGDGEGDNAIDADYRNRTNTDTTAETETTTSGISFPVDELSSRNNAVSGIGAALGVDSSSGPPPSNISRNVSQSSSMGNPDMFNSLSELGEIDDIELDFSNMFANEQFVQASGGWVASGKVQQDSIDDGKRGGEGLK